MLDPQDGHRLEIQGLSKSFGTVKVLDSVSLNLEPGRVHALLGHNGSGKSTLIRILAGVYGYEEGSIRRGTIELQQKSPKASAEFGIRFVHQRKNVVGQLTGADNAGLGGNYRTRGLFIDWRRQREHAISLVNRVRSNTIFDPRERMGLGPEILKTYLAIGRALDQVTHTGILVLDEPTASLSPAESDELLETVDALRAHGTAILYVTHRLHEVERIADDITVLRDGRVTLQASAEGVTYEQLVGALAATEAGGQPGAATREVNRRETKSSDDSGDPRVSGLTVSRLSTALVEGIDLHVAGGEVVGVAGADGSGREDIARALGGGLKDATLSSVRTIRGQASHHLTPRAAQKLGIALALESRSPGAVIDAMSIEENLGLRLNPREGRTKPAEAKKAAQHWISQLGILPQSEDTILAVMSGGNRQKVVIAAALSLRPDVLLVDDPTAGVDVNAAAQLRNLIVGYARETHAAVLWASSDLEELEQVSDRVICMRNGTVSAELNGERITESNILTEIG